MKKVFGFLAIAVIIVSVAITGCNKDMPKPDSNEQVAVNLMANIKMSAITTRVANDQFEAADKVGLFMKRAGQPLEGYGAIYPSASNVQMNIENGKLIANPPVMYPSSANVDFIAYYPYNSIASSDYTIPINVADQTSNLPEEILYSNNAANQTPTASAVSLNFIYSLAKLELTVTGGANSALTASDFAGVTVSIEGLYTQAKLQLADGTFADKQAKEAISMKRKSNTSGSATFEALLLPTLNEPVTFLFNVGGVVYRNETSLTFSPENLYKFNFSLDFPDYVTPLATLMDVVIIPRTENPPQDINVDAGFTMTMETQANEISLLIGGTGRMTIDWGDGNNETYTFDNYNVSVGIFPPIIRYKYSGSTNHTITITGDNITVLYCSDNQLINLDVSKIIALYRLDCSNNQLTDLDVSNNVELRILNASGCQLTNLDVSNNTKLRFLGLTGCRLEQMGLDLSNNVGLWSLSLSNCLLKNLDLSNNTTLYTIDCCGNLFDDNALNDLFGTLHNIDAATLNLKDDRISIEFFESPPYKSISIGNNPGTDTCNKSIAEDNGWTVID